MDSVIQEIPWTKIPMNFNLEKSIQRIILFEKYDKSITIHIKLINFFISELQNCSLFFNKNYPNFTYYGRQTNKNIDIIIKKCESRKIIYFKYENLGKWYLVNMLLEDKTSIFKNSIIEYLFALENIKESYKIDYNQYRLSVMFKDDFFETFYK